MNILQFLYRKDDSFNPQLQHVQKVEKIFVTLCNFYSVIHLAENFFIPNHVARCENHVNKKCSKPHSLAQFVEPPKSYHAKHRFFSGGHRNGNSDAVFISDLHFSLFKLSDPIFSARSKDIDPSMFSARLHKFACRTILSGYFTTDRRNKMFVTIS